MDKGDYRVYNAKREFYSFLRVKIAVAPYVGAWIEMVAACIVVATTIGRSLHRSVD